MNETIYQFLMQLDADLASLVGEGERLDLYQLGRSVLILHHQLKATRDFDIVQMRTSLEEKAVQLFGKGTARAEELGLYLELVPQGLPPVPQWFCSRCTEVPGRWGVLRLWRPEPHDLAATKLKSYRAQDREDLMFMCERGLLRAEDLRASLESAFLWTTAKDGDPDRDRAFANLDRVIAYLEGRVRSL
jgi:hypothetical protein